MNAPMEAKKSPEVKPRVSRVVEAACISCLPTRMRNGGWAGGQALNGGTPEIKTFAFELLLAV